MTARVSVTDLTEEAGEIPALSPNGKPLFMRQTRPTALAKATAFEEKCNMTPLTDGAARLYLVHVFLL